jgi:hypothetical protein
MAKRIVWAEPPQIKRPRKATVDRDAAFFDALKDKPRKWAIYRDKSTYAVGKKVPFVQFTNRSNGDGTYTVYARFNP